MNITGTQLKL